MGEYNLIWSNDRFAPWQVEKLTEAGIGFDCILGSPLARNHAIYNEKVSGDNQKLTKVLREAYEEYSILLANSQAPNSSEIIGAMKAIENIAEQLGVVLRVEQHDETEAQF